MPRKSQTRKVHEGNANPLFTQWLKEWRDEAASKNSNAKHTYTRALQSLNKFPLPLKSGKECNILKNFGQKICDLLDKKLEEHRRLHPDFDEKVSVPIPQTAGKRAKRVPKNQDPTGSAEQQPGPSQARGTVKKNVGSSSQAKLSLKDRAQPILKLPATSNNSKSSVRTSLKVNKPYAKIPRVRIAKSNASSSSQRPQIPIGESRVPSPSRPVILSPPGINLPRFSIDNLVASPTEEGNKARPEIIDLGPHVDSPEPNADVDSLLSLTERLLARTTGDKEISGDFGTNGNRDDVIDGEDDDCVIVLENIGTRGDQQPKNLPDPCPMEPRSLLEHILDDSSLDCDGGVEKADNKETEGATEDSFMALLPKPSKPSISIADSYLDVAAGIRNKRKNFLDKLSSQPTQERSAGPVAGLPSFFNSPNHSVECDKPVSPPLPKVGNGVGSPDVFPPQDSVHEKSDIPHGTHVSIELSEDSEEELLIPLAQRLRVDKPRPPSPVPPQNDSFAQLMEDFETPPASRLAKATEAGGVSVAETEPTRKRKKTKAAATVDVDAVPKKRARKNKEKPPPAQTVPIRIYDLRYVPEGSKPPDRSSSNQVGHQSSKCPHKISLRPGTFDIILCVDSCEATGGVNTKKKEAMIQALQTSGVKMEVRKMNVGDFAWIAKSGDHELVLDCVVERKRTDDLASSIKDGRYAEQKHRLITSGIKRKIYLIEEFNRFATGGITDQALLQAQMNTQVISDFIVKQTKNTKESAWYLTTLTRALELKYKNLHLRSCLKEEAQMFENHLMTWQEYNEAGYKRKKVCTREMFIRALMVVRGMSLERALTIATVYPTVTALLQAFDGCDEVRQKEKLLADLRCPISRRRIGPALSKVLKQIFVDGHSDQ